MPDEQPQYFTLIDLILELLHVALISAGCYVGWTISNSVVGLFVGGCAGRLAWVCGITALRSLGEPHEPEEEADTRQEPSP